MRAHLLAAALALAPGVAHAQAGTFQGIDAHGFVLVPSDGDLKDYTSTWRAELHRPISFGLDGLFEYANQPLVIVHKLADGDEERIPLLEHVVALNLGGMLALHERIGIGVSVPLYLWTYTNESRGPAFGDLKLQVPVHLVSVGNNDKGRVGFSLVPFGSAPTGPTNRYLGTGSWGGGGLVAVSFEKRRFDLSANVGAQYRPRIDYENLTGGPDLLAALGVAYELTDRIALRLEFNSQPNLQAAEADNQVAASEVPAQAVLSARGYITPHLAWTAGLGTAITRGAGAAPLRVFAGIHWVIGTEHLLDKDGDGFADKDDQCVNDPETINGWQDDDGCPDVLTALTFEIVDENGEPIQGVQVTFGGENIGMTNSRGIVSASELVPGDTMRYDLDHSDLRYQPIGDNVTLGEGEQTQRIMMPWAPRPVRAIAENTGGQRVPATVAFAGGPAPQGNVWLGDDGEEIIALAPGSWTLTFESYEYESVKKSVQVPPGSDAMDVVAVLEGQQVAIVGTKFEFSDQVFFEFDKAVLKPSSAELMDRIAEVLRQDVAVLRVGVYGHTSDEGTDAYNMDLSQRRVEAVVEALVERGVDRGRLEPEGFGESKPIVANDTEENRARNRRVEFVILERSE